VTGHCGGGSHCTDERRCFKQLIRARDVGEPATVVLITPPPPQIRKEGKKENDTLGLLDISSETHLGRADLKREWWELLDSNHHEKWVRPITDVASTALRKRRNGSTHVGCPGQTALRSEQYDVYTVLGSNH
jgi:hypothetical protein